MDAKEFNPKVSIVIPVYNGANYLKEAIDSALGQTYENIEVIVVNDGSDDGGKTEDIARYYGDRIRYFFQKNGGVASALNKGIREMSGSYFSWLSHDDMYFPDKTEKQVACLRESDNQDKILYSDYAYINDDSEQIGEFRVNRDAVENALIAVLSTSVYGCAVLIPKTAFQSVGYFNDKLLTVQDTEMWMRIHMAGFAFAHMPDQLAKLRIHGEQGQVRMRALNMEESHQFYLWIFDELRDQVTASADMVLKVLIQRNENIPLMVFLQKFGHRIPIRKIADYKVRLYKKRVFRLLYELRQMVVGTPNSLTN